MKLKTFGCFVLIAFVASLASAQQSSSLLNAVRSGASNIDWPQFNFDSAHDGYNPYETILSPANVGDVALKWSYTPDNNVTGSPAIVNGVVYFLAGTTFSGHGAVYALNSDTGAFIWKYEPETFLFGSPAVANGMVYVSQGYLYALDASTGALIWQSQDDSYGITPTVVNNIVYVGGGNYVDALNGNTGTVIWRHQLASVPNSSPTVADGVLYVNSGSGTMDALNADTGALIWERQLGASLSIRSSLGHSDFGQAVASGVVYVGVKTRGHGLPTSKLYALDAGTGTTIWVDDVNILTATPAVANGVVYVGVVGTQSLVRAFNASTGAPIWQYQLEADDVEAPIVANGVVYSGSWLVGGLGTGYYTITALDASTGDLLWNTTSFGAGHDVTPTPAVVNGMIYGIAVQYGFGAFGLPNQ